MGYHERLTSGTVRSIIRQIYHLPGYHIHNENHFLHCPGKVKKKHRANAERNPSWLRYLVPKCVIC